MAPAEENSPTTVVVVFFLIELFAGEHRLLDIDDDHMVAAVTMRCKLGFMFSAQDQGVF